MNRPVERGLRAGRSSLASELSPLCRETAPLNARAAVFVGLARVAARPTGLRSTDRSGIWVAIWLPSIEETSLAMAGRFRAASLSVCEISVR